MWRILIYLLAALLVAAGMTYFADRPGNVVVDWRGYEVEASVYVAAMAVLGVVLVALALWSLLRYLANRPDAISEARRGQETSRGLVALRQGMIALSVGDQTGAERQAVLARQALPDDPLTGLLQARSAEARGDRATAQRIFADMAKSEATELLGLRGLFHQAITANETGAARQYAQRAVRIDPKIAWGVESLFDLDCQAEDWDAALKTLELSRQHGHVDRETAERRRAVLLTAQALKLETSEAATALERAMEAHKLAPDLGPAAELAGRLLTASGQATRAQRCIARTWRLAPHPDLAQAYAQSPPGATAHDRLKRVRELAELTPGHVEAALALANAALEAREWQTARKALGALIDGRPSARICAAMARIESGEFGGNGRVREWLARAVRAPHDPVWTADGVISDNWAPISPVTGKLDAFEWKVPYKSVQTRDEALTIEMPAKAEAETVTVSEAASGSDKSEAKVAAVDPIPLQPDDDDGPETEVADLESEDVGPSVVRSAHGGAGDGPGHGHDTPPETKKPDFYVSPRAPDDPGPIGRDRKE